MQLEALFDTAFSATPICPEHRHQGLAQLLHVNTPAVKCSNHQQSIIETRT
jgi:hypothetical protein